MKKALSQVDIITYQLYAGDTEIIHLIYDVLRCGCCNKWFTTCITKQLM